MSAAMMYYDYFIGGSFNDAAVDWKWVNGSIIDPNYLMNYPVSGGSGMCLIWSDILYLYDYPCTGTLPAICDIPVSTGLGMLKFYLNFSISLKKHVVVDQKINL